MVSKRALLIGCNYPGTKSELKGCISDVKRVKDLLLHRFGFQEEDVIVMIDTDSKSIQPTGSNIRKGLSKIVAETEEGDVLFVHFSGHGVRVPPESGKEDDTGYDECIVPTDLNLISDDDFREIVNKVPEGVILTLVSDSCHSGGLIESAKEQIGASTKNSSSSSSSQTTTRGLDLTSERTRGYEQEGYGRQEYASGYGAPGYGFPPPPPGGGFHGGFPPHPPPPFGAPSGFHPPPPHGHHGGYDHHQPPPQTYPPPHGAYDQSGYSGYPSQTYSAPVPAPAAHQTSAHGSKSQAKKTQTNAKVVNRSLPIGVLTQMLSEKAGKHVDIGNIRTTLFSVFGGEASPMVKTFMGLMLAQAPSIIEKLKGSAGEAGGGGGKTAMMLGMVQNFMSEYMEGQSSQQSVIEDDPVISAVQSGEVSAESGYAGSKSTSARTDTGILISGCQSDETSADASVGGSSYGAMSNAIVTVLSHHPDKISNRELVVACRQMLEEQGYAQHPCLYCDDAHLDQPYICS